MVELLASGRTAEVFAWGDGRVLKLDRPDWNGLSAFEAAALATLADTGVPAPRLHETVTVGDRHGVVIDRVDGPILADVVNAAADLEPLATTWIELHQSVNAHVVTGLPDLVTGLADGVQSSGLGAPLVEELLALLDDVDDGRRALCHFDLHPGNVIVGADGWVVIDWMTASSGPPDADFARTLVLDAPNSVSARGRFMALVATTGAEERGIDRLQLADWVRIIAGARLAEGFEGEHADYLTSLAAGTRHLGGSL